MYLSFVNIRPYRRSTRSSVRLLAESDMDVVSDRIILSVSFWRKIYSNIYASRPSINYINQEAPAALLLYKLITTGVEALPCDGLPLSDIVVAIFPPCPSRSLWEFYMVSSAQKQASDPDSAGIPQILRGTVPYGLRQRAGYCLRDRVRKPNIKVGRS